MLPVDYLLISITAAFLLGGWALIRAARVAPDGYEDEWGFHAGSTPAWILLGPAAVPTTASVPHATTPACIPEAPAALQPEARTIRGSKPPMLPADLQADDLNPRSPQHDASDKADRL